MRQTDEGKLVLECYRNIQTERTNGQEGNGMGNSLLAFKVQIANKTERRRKKERITSGIVRRSPLVGQQEY